MGKDLGRGSQSLVTLLLVAFWLMVGKEFVELLFVGELDYLALGVGRGSIVRVHASDSTAPAAIFNLMSTTRSGKIYYYCMNGHAQMDPCNGHALEIAWHNTSDTVAIYIDGEQRFCCDDNDWAALMTAIEAGRLRNTKVDGWKDAAVLLEAKSDAKARAEVEARRPPAI